MLILFLAGQEGVRCNFHGSSHEADKYLTGTIWQCKTFNGYCQVILEAGKMKDDIKFEAMSEGLQTGSADIHSMPSHPNRYSPDRYQFF